MTEATATGGGAIWVLGATGRSGRGIARRLREAGHLVVMAGRDADRTAAGLGVAGVVSGSLESLLTQLRAAAPAVVVNTIGPFARTSVRAIAQTSDSQPAAQASRRSANRSVPQRTGSSPKWLWNPGLLHGRIRRRPATATKTPSTGW